MHQSMHHFCIHFMHYIDCYFLYFFCALTLSNAVYPWFLFPFFVFYFFLSFPTLSIMVRKTRAKKTTTPSTLTFESDRFRSEKNQETYEKFNIFRLVWAEHKVILDELDLDIRRNFERMGWLLLLEVEYPPSIALIKEFYSNLSVHSDDSNTQYVRSWIRAGYYSKRPMLSLLQMHLSLIHLVTPLLRSLWILQLLLSLLLLHRAMLLYEVCWTLS